MAYPPDPLRYYQPADPPTPTFAEKPTGVLSNVDEAFETSIVGCARCGGDGHDQLVFKPLTHPVLDQEGNVLFTHWCICPSILEPILLISYSMDEYEAALAERAETVEYVRPRSDD